MFNWFALPVTPPELDRVFALPSESTMNHIFSFPTFLCLGAMAFGLALVVWTFKSARKQQLRDAYFAARDAELLETEVMEILEEAIDPAERKSSPTKQPSNFILMRKDGELYG